MQVSFFDKFKAGVTEAGNKAMNVVEVNRLKLQNSSKQNEIDKQYQLMGKMLFEATLNELQLPREAYAVSMDRVLVLKKEIEANLGQMAALGDAKHCKSCGSSVPADARFCPNCGHTFEAAQEPQVPQAPQEPQEPLIPQIPQIPQEPVVQATPLSLDKKDTEEL